jgi:hypothetical protein
MLLEIQGLGFCLDATVDVHLFTPALSGRRAPFGAILHRQKGVSFGQRLENAVEALAQLGYQEIVIIGQDCPDLEPLDIRSAFELLRTHSVILGPDQNGGCYLIGIHSCDREKLHGIRWQRNTDFRELCARYSGADLVHLSVKIELDTLEDIWLLAESRSPFRWVARGLIEALLTCIVEEIRCVPALFEEERIDWQLPPPVVH